MDLLLSGRCSPTPLQPQTFRHRYETLRGISQLEARMRGSYGYVVLSASSITLDSTCSTKIKPPRLGCFLPNLHGYHIWPSHMQECPKKNAGRAAIHWCPVCEI